METKEIVKSENGISTEIVETTPTTLIQLAIQQNVDVDKLEKLMQLQERWEASKARKEFFQALAEFQSKCPVITKNKKADFQSKQGGRVNYSYATLDQIIDQLREPLRNHGLSYRWEFSEPEKTISVKCIITHSGGHAEFTTMTGSADNSGVKNDIQARGSTLTYLQRYTLIGALGIGTAQEDIDGKKKTDGEPAKVDPEIMENILLFTDENKLLEWAKGLDKKTQENVQFRNGVRNHIANIKRTKGAAV